MPKSVFVCGPAGCGKTKNAEVLKKKYGLKAVIDGWAMGDNYFDDGFLYLTNESPEEVEETLTGPKVVSFKEAMKNAI